MGGLRLAGQDVGGPQLDGASVPVAPVAPVAPVVDSRVLGVLPNYRTSDMSIPFRTLTTKQKFKIAFKDSVDYPVFLTSAAFSALYQLQDQNPSFGQGMKGYSQRYAWGYADHVIGNVMTEALLPSLF